MSCQKIRQHLGDYLDDEIPAAARRRLERHLAACPGCRDEYEGLRSVQREARRIDPELRPSRDLWPTIRSRIEESEPAVSSWWIRLAAAVIALAVLTVPLSVWWVGSRDSGQTAVESRRVEDEHVKTRAVLARSEDGVLLPRTDLMEAIERHRDIIDAETLQIWEENMIVLDRAIGELRSAIEEDPQNPKLRMLLASRYQQERKLLQKVSRV